MGTETSAAIAALGETVKAGFARMEAMGARMDAGFARADHFFELQQAQHVELRAELRDGLAGVRAEIAGLTARVDRLERQN